MAAKRPTACVGLVLQNKTPNQIRVVPVHNRTSPVNSRTGNLHWRSSCLWNRTSEQLISRSPENTEVPTVLCCTDLQNIVLENLAGNQKRVKKYKTYLLGFQQEIPWVELEAIKQIEQGIALQVPARRGWCTPRRRVFWLGLRRRTELGRPGIVLKEGGEEGAARCPAHTLCEFSWGIFCSKQPHMFF